VLSRVAVTNRRARGLVDAVTSVTARWCKQRKREEREKSASRNRRYAMTRRQSVTIKDAAWQIMEDAYRKASSNGTLPAHARQIMYAARGHIQRTADRPLGKDFDVYFTQTLLPDYINETGVTWNVVFDARGSLLEPHTNAQVPLGTLKVREYLARVHSYEVPELEFNVWEPGFPTQGPRNRFGAILFIEKEGFMPLFSHVRLAERYDVAIMSTKGMSVIAARSLVDAVCAEHDIPLLVLHDFDVAGFSIVGTLQGDTRRYQFQNEIKVVDLGMRLADINGLETEDVTISSPDKTQATLERHGATEDEIVFLMERRVELNALTSADLVAWVERKLEDNGVSKVVPDSNTLNLAFQRMRRQAVIQARINEVLSETDQADVSAVPPDLGARVAASLAERPELRWDAVLRRIVEEDEERGGSS
jgi:hypothetical protein